MNACPRCGKGSESYVEKGVAIAQCAQCGSLEIELTSKNPDLSTLRRFRLALIRERVRERTGEAFLDEPEFEEPQGGESYV